MNKIPDIIDGKPKEIFIDFVHGLEYQQVNYATAAVSAATFLLTQNAQDAAIVGGAHYLAHLVGTKIEDTTKSQFTFASQINLAGTTTFAAVYYLTGDWKQALAVTAAHAATHYYVNNKQGGLIGHVESVERTFGFNL